jgi:hypothetical protein
MPPRVRWAGPGRNAAPSARRSNSGLCSLIPPGYLTLQNFINEYANGVKERSPGLPCHGTRSVMWRGYPGRREEKNAYPILRNAIADTFTSPHRQIAFTRYPEQLYNDSTIAGLCENVWGRIIGVEMLRIVRERYSAVGFTLGSL